MRARASDYAASVTLIGRRRELAAVEELLERAAAGTGGHLIVTGPSGMGKTALADAAAQMARERGLPLLRAAGADADRGLRIWERLFGGLDDLDTAEGRTGTARGVPLLGERPSGAGEQPAGTRPPDPDRIAGAIAAGGPRLLLIDDLDRAGEEAVSFLPLLVGRLGSGATALLVTASEPLGSLSQVRLRALTEGELATLTDLPAEAVHAVWLASAGRPAVALASARELAGLDPADDALTHLALNMPSRAGFLDLDAGLIRLLEVAAERPSSATVRARVLARLARELLGDPSVGERRRALIDEAVTLARAAGIPGVLAEVLDSGLHALWDPAAAHERLVTASEIVEQARRAGDAVLERRGMFWRFTALAELGDLGSAEAALTAYARAGELADDAEAAVVVLARQSMLATIRGQFETAERLAAEMAVRGRRAGMADTERLVGTLRSSRAVTRGDFEALVEPWLALARWLPGHFFEAAAARALVETGRTGEAALELQRLLPAVLAGSGPRWLGVVADLAVVASKVGEPATAEALYGALLPYRGRLVVWGGANTITGPVDDYLGRLAARLGRLDDAVAHLESAVALEQWIGALPWRAQTLVALAQARSARDGIGDRHSADSELGQARSIAEQLAMDGLSASLARAVDEWRLGRDGDDWLLEAGTERVRLRDGRGVRYLGALLAAPGQEIAALDLVAGGAGLRVPEADPVLDDAARASYRRRLDELDEQLESADRVGDPDRARSAQAERTALVAELRRATGLGGRPRVQSDEAERARVNATRALWATVHRVESAAPLVGAHLRVSLHTGRLFRYQPAPGGPAHWSVRRPQAGA